MQNNKLKILGLTGGIASGKSTASAYLEKSQGYIFDCDKLAHSVMLKGNPAYNEIIDKIKGDYLKDDYEIDRKKMGNIVFNDNSKLAILESIVHKYVGEHIFSGIEKLNKNNENYKFIVIDAPLLIESKIAKKCDSVWVIEAHKNIRVKRIMERNNLTQEEAEHRIKIQTHWDEIDKTVYVIIKNEGQIDELEEKIKSNLESFLTT